nr:hypothetical protein [Rhodococcus sp. (in: high G+C Gram-positive bacteria)]
MTELVNDPAAVEAALASITNQLKGAEDAANGVLSQYKSLSDAGSGAATEAAAEFSRLINTQLAEGRAAVDQLNAVVRTGSDNGVQIDRAAAAAQGA